MPKQPRVRTPFRHWWQRLRYQYVPYLTFLGCVALVLYLWQRQLGQPNAVGEVAALRVDATSPFEGKLIAVPGNPLRLAKKVNKDEILALIDDGPLLAELAALQVELLELQGQIPATIGSERTSELDRNADLASELRRQQADARRERTDLAAERRRLDERLERLRLEEIQRRAEALVYRVTYDVQSAKAKRLEDLAVDKLLDLRGSFEAYDAQAARDEAKQGLDGVAQSLESIQQLRDNLMKAAAELDTYERTIENHDESFQAVQERERLLIRLDQLRHEEELLRAQSNLARVDNFVRNAYARYSSRLDQNMLALTRPDMYRNRIIPPPSDSGDVTEEIETIGQDRAKLLDQLAALGPVGGANVDQLLTPIHAAIDAKCRQIELVCKQYELLEVRAPATGTIATVWARPGQTVTAGALVATIAAPDIEYIVSYIRQEQPLRPEPGMIVEVRPRRKPLESFPAAVASVGPQVELIPEHQRMIKDANQLEWGLPVWITVPAEGKLRPGELVDLRFHARPTQ